MCSRSSCSFRQVESVLPSSTATISCGTLRRRNPRCRCSIVEQIHPSSLWAGITTLRSRNGAPFGSSGDTPLALRISSPVRGKAKLRKVAMNRPQHLAGRACHIGDGLAKGRFLKWVEKRASSWVAPTRTSRLRHTPVAVDYVRSIIGSKRRQFDFVGNNIRARCLSILT